MSLECCSRHAARHKLDFSYMQAKMSFQVKPEPLEPADAAELDELRQFYLVPMDVEKQLAQGARLRKSKGLARIQKYPGLHASLLELNGLERHASMLRLLRALIHYDTVGALRGEKPPSDDYFGRKRSRAATARDSSVRLVEVCTVHGSDSDDDPAAAGVIRSHSAIDVEEYLLSHPGLWDQSIAQGAAAAAVMVKDELPDTATGGTSHLPGTQKGPHRPSRCSLGSLQWLSQRLIWALPLGALPT